jgi:hypothetical protein
MHPIHRQRRHAMGQLLGGAAILSAGSMWGHARAAKKQLDILTKSRAAPLFGTYLGGGCVGKAKIAAFEAWAGRPLELIVDFLPTLNWDNTVGTAWWVGGCWVDVGKTMVISIPMLPKDGVSTIANGANGQYDQYFKRIAEIFVKKGLSRLIVRLGWEFNGTWFPWRLDANNQEAWAEYWRRIVTAMRSVPGGDFRFDWCPAMTVGVNNPVPAYPGDEYVDIIGADVYNENWYKTAVSAEERWQKLLNASYGLQWHRQFSTEHKKPMSYPEWGTGRRPDGHGGGDDPVFMRNMTDWMLSNNVEYQSYWNYPAKDYNAMLSDGSQPASEAVFLQAFGGRKK